MSIIVEVRQDAIVIGHVAAKEPAVDLIITIETNLVRETTDKSLGEFMSPSKLLNFNSSGRLLSSPRGKEKFPFALVKRLCCSSLFRLTHFDLFFVHSLNQHSL